MLSRKTFAEVSLSSYRHNLRHFTERIRPSRIMAVVKSNAYGHGMVEISEAAISEGIDCLAVAFIEEALELRKKNIAVPIIVFNYFEPAYVRSAKSAGLSLTISSNEQLQELKASSEDLKGLKVHLKIDTGMKRLGIRPEDAVSIVRDIDHQGMLLEGVYSHLSCADEEDEAFSLLQQKAFDAVLDELENVNILPEYRHLCNSAGAFRFNSERYSHVRLGIAGYGLQPSARFFDPNLRPVLRWKTAVSMVKSIFAGERVSYGGTFTADRTMRVATIPVGYGDGYSRLLSNSGEVLISGVRCRVIGRVCMDQFVVDVTDLKESPSIGSEAVLIGEQGEDKITAEEMAEKIGTINYEVTCSISGRVPRVFL